MIFKKREETQSIYNDKVIGKEGVIYNENTETGLINIDIKLDRVKNGGCFEWEDMINCNKAIGKRFITDDIKNIIDIGSGVGTFEYNNAPEHANVHFIASEMDEKSTEWVKQNRPMPNVEYCTSSMEELKGRNFDMAVTIDVLEHVRDYRQFLEEFSKLSDYAVISTPNRDRSITEISGPTYKHHVQEFNAGELFFILKMFYKDVQLYSFPDPYKEELVKVGLYSTYYKLVAVCRK